jgi:3-oxoadipate enol-lactonase
MRFSQSHESPPHPVGPIAEPITTTGIDRRIPSAAETLLAVLVVPLVFDDYGEGVPVVLLHGHPFNRSLWNLQKRPLVDAGFRVVVPDIRGYGASPVTPGTVTMGELAGDVAALLTQLDLERPVVIGLSMGGLVAMELAISGPPIRALGLVATTAEPVTADEHFRRQALAAAAEKLGMGPIVEQMGVGLFPPGRSPEMVALVTDMMKGNNPMGAAAALRGRSIRPDYRPGLATMRIPTFVCVGSADPWSTREVTDGVVACLSNPHVTVMPGIGHLPNLEAPEAFNRQLIQFLNLLD